VRKTLVKSSLGRTRPIWDLMEIGYVAENWIEVIQSWVQSSDFVLIVLNLHIVTRLFFLYGLAF
jgi:hypothetical protein